MKSLRVLASILIITIVPAVAQAASVSVEEAVACTSVRDMPEVVQAHEDLSMGAFIRWQMSRKVPCAVLQAKTAVTPTGEKRGPFVQVRHKRELLWIEAAKID